MDLLLKRYSNIEYVLNMELFDFVELLNKAMDKDFEDKMWVRWLSEKPNMKKQISFANYLELFIPKVKTEIKTDANNNTAKENIEKAERIKNTDQKRGE